MKLNDPESNQNEGLVTPSRAALSERILVLEIALATLVYYNTSTNKNSHVGVCDHLDYCEQLLTKTDQN